VILYHRCIISDHATNARVGRMSLPVGHPVLAARHADLSDRLIPGADVEIDWPGLC
jgi:hypothetical protein